MRFFCNKGRSLIWSVTHPDISIPAGHVIPAAGSVFREAKPEPGMEAPAIFKSPTQPNGYTRKLYGVVPNPRNFRPGVYGGCLAGRAVAIPNAVFIARLSFVQAGVLDADTGIVYPTTEACLKGFLIYIAQHSPKQEVVNGLQTFEITVSILSSGNGAIAPVMPNKARPVAIPRKRGNEIEHDDAPIIEL